MSLYLYMIEAVDWDGVDYLAFVTSASPQEAYSQYLADLRGGDGPEEEDDPWHPPFDQASVTLVPAIGLEPAVHDLGEVVTVTNADIRLASEPEDN